MRAREHDIAQRIGSTQTTNPEDFLKELMTQYLETKVFSVGENTFDANAQIRWLIGKLTSRAVDKIYGERITTLPSTYTEANLELSATVADYDFGSFTQTIKSLSGAQN